jgi:hypothetical protein
VKFSAGIGEHAPDLRQRSDQGGAQRRSLSRPASPIRRSALRREQAARVAQRLRCRAVRRVPQVAREFEGELRRS